jgi:hypothetical protein
MVLISSNDYFDAASIPQLLDFDLPGALLDVDIDLIIDEEEVSRQKDLKGWDHVREGVFLLESPNNPTWGDDWLKRLKVSIPNSFSFEDFKGPVWSQVGNNGSSSIITVPAVCLPRPQELAHGSLGLGLGLDCFDISALAEKAARTPIFVDFADFACLFLLSILGGSGMAHTEGGSNDGVSINVKVVTGTGFFGVFLLSVLGGSGIAHTEGGANDGASDNVKVVTGLDWLSKSASLCFSFPGFACETEERHIDGGSNDGAFFKVVNAVTACLLSNASRLEVCLVLCPECASCGRPGEANEGGSKGATKLAGTDWWPNSSWYISASS